MQTTLKFICCSEYDFVDAEGKRVSGISCKCFDMHAKKIVKVRTNHFIDADFGDDIDVNIVPNGNYLNYEVA